MLEAVQAVADVCGVCRPLLTCDVCGVCRPNTTSYFNAFVTYDYLLSIGMKPWIELGCARPPARLGPVACGGLAGVGAASTLVFFFIGGPGARAYSAYSAYTGLCRGASSYTPCWMSGPAAVPMDSYWSVPRPPLPSPAPTVVCSAAQLRPGKLESRHPPRKLATGRLLAGRERKRARQKGGSKRRRGRGGGEEKRPQPHTPARLADRVGVCVCVCVCLVVVEGVGSLWA